MKLRTVSCFLLLSWIISCTGCGKVLDTKKSTAREQLQDYPEFTAETEVTVAGYDGHIMEPFISPDGNYLFFNSLNDGINTSLYYAEKVDDTTFTCIGEIHGVNRAAPHLDAVASMDSNNRFYFVSTRDYPDIAENYQSGDFNNGTVSNVQPVTGDFYIYEAGWLIMDAEINPAGTLLYYVNAHFTGQALPEETRLGIAEKGGDDFSKINSSDTILENINNSNYLVYAPSISADGLELYFTRLKKGTSDTEICVSVRSGTSDVFSVPKKINLSGYTAEAPTLTFDGERIYYHKKKSRDGHYKLFFVTRK